MNDKNDWRQTVISQHQMWATLVGFNITGLILFAAFIDKDRILESEKILGTVVLACLILQVPLMLVVSEVERRTAWKSIPCLSELENVLRTGLNIIITVSWLFLSVLLLVSIWKK